MIIGNERAVLNAKIELNSTGVPTFKTCDEWYTSNYLSEIEKGKPENIKKADAISKFCVKT